MRKHLVDVVVVGGGQSGICVSYFLKSESISHVVLERDEAFSAWEHRWDSFQMNTPNWMNVLPGIVGEFAPDSDRSGFGTKEDALNYFRQYLKEIEPPISEHTNVTSIRQGVDGYWTVDTSGIEYQCKAVVICTGAYPSAKIPPVSKMLPSHVVQMHSSDYRNPAQVDSNDVLVVGSGSSGVQICEDLARSNRFGQIFLSTSGNRVFPKRVFGIPTYKLVRYSGILNVKRGSILGRFLLAIFPNQQGDLATGPIPRELNRSFGVDLVSKVDNIAKNVILCRDGSVVPMEDLTIIWATGYGANYDHIKLNGDNALIDDTGEVMHHHGVADATPNLCFVGLRFQSRIGSRFIYGTGYDAGYVASHLGQLLDSYRRLH